MRRSRYRPISIKHPASWVQSGDYISSQSFRRRSDYTGLTFEGFKPSKYGYDIKVSTKDNYPIMNKHFKSKIKAIEFAEKYMRKSQ